MTRKYHIKLLGVRTISFGAKTDPNYRTRQIEDWVLKEIPFAGDKPICLDCPLNGSCPDFKISRIIGFIIAKCDHREFVKKHFKAPFLSIKE